eukprot:jgi/Astpho2/1866/Aster-00391
MPWQPSPGSLDGIFQLDDLQALKDLQARALAQGQNQQIKQLATIQSTAEKRVLRDLSVLKRRMVREDGTWDIVVIASRLAAMGHQVALRTALGGGRGQECFHHLHHEFLVVTTPGTQDELILDPSFREQFEIPHATVPYQQVLQVVPEEFVGTASRLVPLVQTLCAEMAAAFRASGATLPPWRWAKSMLSKWLPAKVRTLPIVGANAGDSTACEGSSPAGTRRRSAELESFDAMILCGHSPTGPLPQYSSEGHSSSKPSKPPSTSSHAILPQTLTLGFKVSAKSQLSSSLATLPQAISSSSASDLGNGVRAAALPGGLVAGRATPNAKRRASQRSVHSTWELPAIRTVKLSGRQ